MASFNDYVRGYIEMGLSRDNAETLAKETFAVKAKINAEWKQGKYKDLKAPAAKPKPRMPVFKMITDHLGQQFNSTREMCDFYKIPVKLYRGRILLGRSVEEALTTPKKISRIIYKDHLGHKFKSRAAMCDYWGIDPNVFAQRMFAGWDLKRALTTPKRRIHQQYKDHLGHEFSTIKEMCAYWEISESTFRNRQKQGLSLKMSLTAPLVKQHRI